VITNPAEDVTISDNCRLHKKHMLAESSACVTRRTVENNITVISWTEVTVLPIEAITWILTHKTHGIST